MFTKKPVKITTGFSLKRISLLIALVLLSAAALPADRPADKPADKPANSTVVPKGVSTEPLNINYTRTDSASGGEADIFAADFCHTRADELKIRVIPAPGMTVGTDARMTLTITGSGYIKNYAVLKQGSPVSPEKTSIVPATGTSYGSEPAAYYYPAAKAAKDVYITRDFVKPWNIGYAEDVHGRWNYTETVPSTKPGWVYSDRFCFVKFDKIVTQYFTFGHDVDVSVFYDFHYFPIFENGKFARMIGLPIEVTDGLDWGHVLQLGLADKYLYQYGFDHLCKNIRDVPGIDGDGKTTWNDQHYWTEKDWHEGVLVTMPKPVKDNVKKMGKVYLINEMFYMKKEWGNVPIAIQQPRTCNFDDEAKKKSDESSIRFPLFPVPSAKVNAKCLSGRDRFPITSGSGYELTLNNRNISKIELTVTDHNGTQTLSWDAEKGSNNLAYKESGAKIFKSAPAVDQKNDPYADFYQDASSYFRGTLALMNGEYTKYVNEKMPLSLNPPTQGKLNLVNMEELIFTLGGAPGAYTLSVEGQPLKFVDLYINRYKKASAMKLRNACK